MDLVWQHWRHGARTAALAVLAAASLAACATPGGPSSVTTAAPHGGGARGTMRPYQVGGVWYRPREDPGYDQTGVASWYGEAFHNHTTADGEVFDMDVASGAHKTLPLPCIVEVTNLDNHRRIEVRVNDRGPFVDGRIIDLSRRAAKELGFYGVGVARVRVRFVRPAGPAGKDAGLRQAWAWPAEPPSQPAVQSPPPVAGGPATATAAQTWSIQAGAFSGRANAERAAQRLAEAGRARIEPLWRGETLLYRVLVDCPPGTDVAALRARVAGLGFPGATVLAPS